VAGQRPRRPASASLPSIGPGEGGDDLSAGAQARVAAAWRGRPRDAVSSFVREAARWAGAASAPLAPAALAVGASGGAAVRAALLARAPGADGSLSEMRDRVSRSGAYFDGRLRVVAVDRATGRRVIFGAPGAPPASVGQAVQASCSVPWIFAPVPIGEHEYVDGGMWSNTNLDAAPAGRDTEVLCLNPIASLDIARASPFGALRAVAGSAAALELLALRRRGTRVRMIGPERATARLMGADLMDPRPREAVLSGGYAQGLTLARASA
jgi:NTE family protein